MRILIWTNKLYPNNPNRGKQIHFSKDTNVETSSKEDILVIGENLKGIDFKLANCCHPIYGDDVFGFVSVPGGIKIHRTDCPNAPQMIARLGYRIVNAQWSGKSIGS